MGNAPPKVQTEVECPNCGSILAVDEDDWVPSGFVECPICGERIDECLVDKPWRYPDAFFDSSGGVDLDNESINKEIKRLIDEMKKANEPYDFAWTGTGNTMVFVFDEPDEGDYWICVTKAYKDCWFPKGEEWDES